MNIDVKIGGYAHDLTSPVVDSQVKKLAADPRCLAELTELRSLTRSLQSRLDSAGPPKKEAGKRKGEAQREACHKYNSAAGCNREKCKFDHRCTKCGEKGHGASSCSN